MFCGNSNFGVTQDVTRGMDTSLTLKLQKRVTELEQEKQSLRNELENKEDQFQRARARVHVTHLFLKQLAGVFLIQQCVRRPQTQLKLQRGQQRSSRETSFVVARTRAILKYPFY